MKSQNKPKVVSDDHAVFDYGEEAYVIPIRNLNFGLKPQLNIYSSSLH